MFFTRLFGNAFVLPRGYTAWQLFLFEKRPEHIDPCVKGQISQYLTPEFYFFFSFEDILLIFMKA